MTATFLVIYSTPTDPEAFDKHYREVHLPLAKALPGLRRYALATAPQMVRGGVCYLVATLEWDSIAELRAAFGSPAGRATSEDMATLTRLSDVQSMIYELEDA
ncbi:MAG: EthD family reductase [Pseudonocardiales bacterium]|nr:EthD family reductase [Pseudonocardiales bacterium]